MKKCKKLLALLLVAMLVLSACGGGGTQSGNQSGNQSNAGETGNTGDTGDTGNNGNTGDATPAAEPIKDIVVWDTGEVETLFRPHSEGANEYRVTCNTIATLLEFDNHGTLIPGAAATWGTEDGGQTWTFNLRDDVTWVDINGEYKADVVAQDWVTTLEWILNYYKNDSYNTSMAISTIAGAGDYYEYTKSLDEAEALALKATDEAFTSRVGVEAPDDRTLIYHCVGNITYFDTLFISAIMVPTSQKLIDEMGVENMVGIKNDQMWYSGPYILTTFVQDNEKVLTPNPAYFDTVSTRFDSVTIKKIESALIDDQLWESGEVDYTDLAQATLSNILADSSNNPWYPYLVESRLEPYCNSLFFNYAKNLKDGTPDTNWNTAIANENFRKSLYYGLNLTNIWYGTNPVNPLNLEALTFTCKDFVFFSNGDDYSSHVEAKLENIGESNGTTPRRYQPDLAAEYKEKAIEELTAQGITFPVSIDYFIKAGDPTALDNANIYKDVFEALGTDYVVFNIDTYTSSYSEEVMTPKLDSFSCSLWGADFLDVSNWLDQVTYQNPSAAYSGTRMHLDDVTDPTLIQQFTEFTDKVYAAEEIFDDLDARNEAFAEAEAYLLNHALVIPWNLRSYWSLTKINEYSKSYSGCGIGYMYKNWETSSEPYTTEQYQALKDAYYGN